MSRRMSIITGLLIATILVAVFGFDALKKRLIAEKLSAYTPPPVSVTTTTATQLDWAKQISAVGQITADMAVDVTPQISGQIRSIHFHSGDIVEAGQLLVQLDDSLLQDELKRDEAKTRLAQLDVDRYSKLVKENSASQATLDRATVTLQSNEASRDATQTKIEYMKVKAPFSGKLGIRQVNTGEYLQPGIAVVNLQDVAVLYADFSLPELYLPDLKKGLPVKITSDAHPGETYTGSIDAVSPQVDPNSRNVDIRAKVTDKSGALVPGMFVELEVITDNKTTVIPLPDVAIAYSLYGDTVFVVKEKADKGQQPDKDSTTYQVERRSVSVSMHRDSIAGISKGLKVGDQVVTSNQQQLSKTSRITINNDIKLDPDKVKGQ